MSTFTSAGSLALYQVIKALTPVERSTRIFGATFL
jgi:hypothetical protein